MKIEEKSDHKFFLGGLYILILTHFVPVFKKRFFLFCFVLGPMGRFPPGDLAIFRLSDFQRPGAKN